MPQKEDATEADGLKEIAKPRRTFLKASLVGAVGGSSLPLVSGKVRGSTDASSSSATVLYEEDFEEIPLGEAPSDWTKVEGETPFAIYRVVEGGAAGSQRAFRMKTDPYEGHENEDGTEDWGSAVLTPNVDATVSQVQWYWKKPHKWDPENYEDLKAYGPHIQFRNENGKGFLSIKLGDRDGYFSGEQYPLGLNISDGDGNAFIHDVYEADVFSKFVVKPDFDAETFELLVEGSSLGTFGFRRSGSQLSRLYYKAGGWGVTGDAEVDQFRISGTQEQKPTANFSALVNPKMVQDVTDTQVPGTSARKPDPDLVADKRASVSFGVDVDGVSELPESAEADVSVSSKGGTVDNGSFTLSKEELENLSNGSTPASELANVFSGEVSPPTFIPSKEIESVTISIESVETANYSIDGVDFTLEKGTDFKVVEMPSLSIGYIEILSPEENGQYVYGDTADGSIPGNKDQFISNLTQYLLEEYPIDTVTTVDAGTIVGTTETTENGLHGDLLTAYDEISKQSESNLDIKLALVPPNEDGNIEPVNGDGDSITDYFSYHHKPKTAGLEVTNKFVDIQPQYAASVMVFDTSEDGGAVETAAMEITHHFLGYSFEAPYRRTNDSSHIDKDLISNAFQISRGAYEVTPDSHSFMAQGLDSRYTSLRSDAYTHQKLIDIQLKPIPREYFNYVDDAVVMLTGLFNDSISAITNLTTRSGLPMPSLEDGNLTVRTLDGVGSTLTERITSRELHFTHSGGSSDDSTASIAPFAIEFPDTAASLQIETSDDTKTIHPASATLSEIVDNLPAETFKRNPKKRRKSLQNKLDSVDRMMDQHEYKGAAEILENDILAKFESWLVEVDVRGANIPTKQEAMSLCKEMIRRCNRLAEEFQSTGNRS